MGAATTLAEAVALEQAGVDVIVASGSEGGAPRLILASRGRLVNWRYLSCASGRGCGEASRGGRGWNRRCARNRGGVCPWRVGRSDWNCLPHYWGFRSQPDPSGDAVERPSR
jgi:hypothetical protein